MRISLQSRVEEGLEFCPIISFTNGIRMSKKKQKHYIISKLHFDIKLKIHYTSDIIKFIIITQIVLVYSNELWADTLG